MNEKLRVRTNLTVLPVSFVRNYYYYYRHEQTRSSTFIRINIENKRIASKYLNRCLPFLLSISNPVEAISQICKYQRAGHGNHKINRDTRRVTSTTWHTRCGYANRYVSFINETHLDARQIPATARTHTHTHTHTRTIGEFCMSHEQAIPR